MSPSSKFLMAALCAPAFIALLIAIGFSRNDPFSLGMAWSVLVWAYLCAVPSLISCLVLGSFGLKAQSIGITAATLVSGTVAYVYLVVFGSGTYPEVALVPLSALATLAIGIVIGAARSGSNNSLKADGVDGPKY